MVKATEVLNSEIDTNITNNNNGEITGLILNGVLESVANSIRCYYPYPTDDLTTDDVGKLVMSTDEGKAVVYQLSPATDEQTGIWRLTLTEDNYDDFDYDSELIFYRTDNDVPGNIDKFSITYDDIVAADPGPGAMPFDDAEEVIARIKWAIEHHPAYISHYGNLSVSPQTVDGTSSTIVLTETSYDNMEITQVGFPTFALVVEQDSHPALPEAPTVLPLGKLVGIHQVSPTNRQALISNAFIETYTSETAIDVNYALFNNRNNIVFEEDEDMLELLDSIIIPAANGKVKQFDFHELDLDYSVGRTLEHHLLGLAIGAQGTTVSVLHMTQFSFLLGMFLRITKKAVFDDD